jgi:hypothetical protein
MAIAINAKVSKIKKRKNYLKKDRRSQHFLTIAFSVDIYSAMHLDEDGVQGFHPCVGAPPPHPCFNLNA